jgi:alpha-D-ribose 1-methylphosphonate 5-triphosphate synthase subunit PhnH
VTARPPASALAPGFADPVHDAQRVFRAVLDAMAHPGRIATLPIDLEAPAPLSPGAAAVCLALLDFETRLWLQPEAASPAVLDYLRFHCGCPAARHTLEAQFALIADARTMPPLPAFSAGEPEYPDRAATLIVQVERLTDTGGARLRGPGIAAGPARLQVTGLPADFWVQRIDAQADYPLGVDILFVAGWRLAALPRSTRVEI